MTTSKTSLKKDYLKLKGTTFTQWRKDPEDLYIHKDLFCEYK